MGKYLQKNSFINNVQIKLNSSTRNAVKFVNEILAVCTLRVMIAGALTTLKPCGSKSWLTLGEKHVVLLKIGKRAQGQGSTQ